MKIAESLSPITKDLDETTKKIGVVNKESNSEDVIRSNIKTLPNSSKLSTSMRELIGSLMNSRNSLKITQDESGRAKFFGVPIQISEADTIKINENSYDKTPEVYRVFSTTSYTCKIEKWR